MRATKTMAGACCILLALVGAGCGGEASAENGGASEQTAAATPGGGGTGVLTLDGASHEIRIRSCYLDGEYDTADEDYTLSGSGELAGGDRFSVYVGRSDTGIGVQHEVTVRGSGANPLLLMSTRERTNSGWVDAHAPGESPDGPLVHIDGKAVHMSGFFASTNEPDARLVRGSLEATCP